VNTENVHIIFLFAEFDVRIILVYLFS